MKKLILPLALLTAVGVCAQAPAFPGAEGFGRYTTGGRGGKVIHVTTLEDYSPAAKENAIQGSLRQAVSGSTKKTIVFDVSGNIDLKENLVIGANTTIAGQTAPGQGVTLRYYTIEPKNDNIIIRFIRFRRSQVKDVNDGADATWTRNHKNIILDHCSLSWSIDEVASFYDNRDFTMQWCTIAEGLANAGHGKGAHSYGGIWGGKGASFHHNMIAHVDNRAPRFNGARYGWTGYDQTKYTTTSDAERVDFRNCVMYNWGSGGCYGGPGGGYINMVNNYYKAAPDTKNKTRVTQVSVATSGNADTTHPELYNLCCRYYINGNYMAAASSPENYDWNGVAYDGGLVTINGEKYMKDPEHMFGPNADYYTYSGVDLLSVKLAAPSETGEVTTHTAQEAYERVLANVGASLWRDAADARYVEECRTGTTTYIASKNIGGIIDMINDPEAEQNPSLPSFPELAVEQRAASFDTDGDGIPDTWEEANGLNPNSASDGNLTTLDPKGWYTNLEVYLSSLVEKIMKDGNANAIDGVDEYYPSFAEASISDVTIGESAIMKVEYYDLNGIRLAEPREGISIRRIIYSDGSVSTDKVIKK